ncbi:MAG: hypothetical protein IPO27_07630 [Bacteroidetes bacterium]|nr:hypothetical protein [Bacteroidota bacterium]
MDLNGNTIPVDFVKTGNNHHVAIYKNEIGDLQEMVVSFYEAVERVNQGLSAIDKSFKREAGWEFQFTMKQNECFVFHDEKTGFNPHEIDLHNPDNYHLISPYLFRVQKLASKNYMFRHHLETNVIDRNELKEVAFINIRSLSPMSKTIKVRINHLGKIVTVGEED